MKIQIAGIRNLEDALMCAELGADSIALLAGQKHESKDFITKELAKQIVLKLPIFCSTVLITHLEEAGQIIKLAKFIGVNAVQIHSNVKDTVAQKVRSKLPFVKIIRLIHIDEGGEILSNLAELTTADCYITDSINKKTGQVGGTGLMHNLATDAKLVKELNKPVIIAGGLTPENVAQAIQKVKPYAIDVNSGLKNPQGFKDKIKVKKFVQNARAALK